MRPLLLRPRRAPRPLESLQVPRSLRAAARDENAGAAKPVESADGGSEFTWLLQRQVEVEMSLRGAPLASRADVDASRADGRTIVFGNHPRGVLVNARHWLISRHDPALRHLVPSTTATPSLAYLAILAIGHADARPRADLARAWRAMVRDATRRTSNDA